MDIGSEELEDDAVVADEKGPRKRQLCFIYTSHLCDEDELSNRYLTKAECHGIREGVCFRRLVHVTFPKTFTMVMIASCFLHIREPRRAESLRKQGFPKRHRSHDS